MEKKIQEIKLNVPVMNALPYKDTTLQKAIRSLRADGIRCGLYERNKGSGKYELWREALPGEFVADRRSGVYIGDIVSLRFPPLESFTYVWEGSIPLKGFGV